MTRKPTVWFVDDLPDNLTKFQRNHAQHFNIELFRDPSAVLRRIHNKEYPDALLCDVFFYDTPDEALHVERKVDELAERLRRTAIDIRVHDHRYAVGITLMENIYHHFGDKKPPFPMYAYTSKGPFLLEQKDWQDISKYGAEVLLKNRVSPEAERTEIVGDIDVKRRENSLIWRSWIGTSTIIWNMVPGLIVGLILLCITLVVGRLLRGTW
jgi:hypothetical protein